MKRSEMTQAQIDSADVAKELEAILASTELAGAIRLQTFLRYVVEEELAGRGSSIRAKTIGEDLYGVLSNQGDDPLAVVLVDAGRLRRRLETYYSKPENLRTIRIHVDTGGFAPRFEQLVKTVVPSEASLASSGHSSNGKWYVLAGAACVALVLAIVFGSHFQRRNVDDVASEVSDTAIRQALFSTSPAKLQARNLSDEARDLMFPAVDRKRLNAALDLFEQAIELDDQYQGGFAGAGQINALLASQIPLSSERDAFLSASQEQAKRAIDLTPSASWAQSSAAMAAFAAADCKQAQTLSESAITLDPDDFHTLNFDGIISLFCGEFDRAVDVASPLIGSSELAERLVFRNVTAKAEFHRGNLSKNHRFIHGSR